MAAVEVNSFVSKFLALWTNGKKVSLKLNAENGKANLTMELDLGDDGQRSPLNNDTTHFENYRQRRRYRRSNDKSEVDEKIETSSACVKKSPVATKIESNLQDDILENIPEVKEEVVYNNLPTDTDVMSDVAMYAEDVSTLDTVVTKTVSCEDIRDCSANVTIATNENGIGQMENEPVSNVGRNIDSLDSKCFKLGVAITSRKG